MEIEAHVASAVSSQTSWSFDARPSWRIDSTRHFKWRRLSSSLSGAPKSSSRGFPSRNKLINAPGAARRGNRGRECLN